MDHTNRIHVVAIKYCYEPYHAIHETQWPTSEDVTPLIKLTNIPSDIFHRMIQEPTDEMISQHDPYLISAGNCHQFCKQNSFEHDSPRRPITRRLP